MTEVVDLPKPRRAAWVLVLVAGLGLIVLALPSLAAPLDAEPLAFIAAGAGVFLAFFATMMLMVAEKPSRLELSDEQLAIVTLGKERVALPWSSLRQAAVIQQNERPVVALRKADGGWIEIVAARSDEDAEQLRGRLQAGIDGATDEDSPAADPFARLDAFRSIDVKREANRVTLSWSASASWRTLLGLGPIGGLLLVVLGFHLQEPGIGTLIAMGFVAALGALVVTFTLVNLGARQHVRIDAEALCIERWRRGTCIDERRLPIGQIAAIDYTHRLNVVGAGSLTIRSSAKRMEAEAAERAVAGGGEELDPLAGVALLKALAGGVHVPLGRLPFAARVALDVGLSEAVAERAGRPRGAV